MSLGETQSYIIGGETFSSVIISNLTNNTLNLDPSNDFANASSQTQFTDASSRLSNVTKKQNLKLDDNLKPSLTDYTYGARQEVPKTALDMENHLANMLIRGVLSFRELLHPTEIASSHTKKVEALPQVTGPNEDISLSKNQLRKIDSKKKQKEVRRLARRDCNYVVLDFIALCNLPQDAYDYAFSSAQGAEKDECDLIMQRIQERKCQLEELFGDVSRIKEKIASLGMINDQLVMNSYQTLTRTESLIGDAGNANEQLHLIRFQKFVESLILDDEYKHINKDEHDQEEDDTKPQSSKAKSLDPYHSFISILHPETGQIKSSEGNATKQFNWDCVPIWADPLFTGGQLPRKALRKREQVRNVAFILDKIANERKRGSIDTDLRVSSSTNINAYRVIDVGSASGNGSLALAHFFPEIQFLLFDVHEESAKQCLARVCALHVHQHLKGAAFSDRDTENRSSKILCGDLEKALTVEFSKEDKNDTSLDIFGLSQTLSRMKKSESEMVSGNEYNCSSSITTLHPVITFLRSFLEHSHSFLDTNSPTTIFEGNTAITATTENGAYLKSKKLREHSYDDLVPAVSNIAVHQGICPTELISRENEFDCVIATHACGVGTDYAVVQAIERHAALITLPCCTGKIPKQLKEMRQRVRTNELVMEQETEMQDVPRPLVGKRAKLGIASESFCAITDQPVCFDFVPANQSSELKFQATFQSISESNQSTPVFMLDSPGSSRISSQVSHPRSNKFRQASARYKAMLSIDAILGLNVFKKPKHSTNSNNSNNEEDILSRIASFAESTADSATHDVSALQRLCKICLEYDRACQLVEQKYGVVIAKLQPDTASKKNDLLIGIPL